jgi:hypothetical protein
VSVIEGLQWPLLFGAYTEHEALNVLDAQLDQIFGTPAPQPHPVTGPGRPATPSAIKPPGQAAPTQEMRKVEQFCSRSNTRPGPMSTLPSFSSCSPRQASADVELAGLMYVSGRASLNDTDDGHEKLPIDGQIAARWRP